MHNWLKKIGDLRKYRFLWKCFLIYLIWSVIILSTCFISIFLFVKVGVDYSQDTFLKNLSTFVGAAFNVKFGEEDSLPLITIIFVLYNIVFSGYLAYKFIKKSCPLQLSDYIYIRRPDNPERKELVDSIQLNYRVYNKNYEFEKFINITKSLELVKIIPDKNLRVISTLKENPNSERPILELSTNYMYNLSIEGKADQQLVDFLINSINENDESNSGYFFRAVVTAQSADNGQTHTVVKYYKPSQVRAGGYESFYKVQLDKDLYKYSNPDNSKFRGIKLYDENERLNMLAQLQGYGFQPSNTAIIYSKFTMIDEITAKYNHHPGKGTVLFLSDFNQDIEVWDKVQSEVSLVATTFAYKASSLNDERTMALDYDTLLKVINDKSLKPPFIIVANRFGALFGQYLAQQLASACALVLLDPHYTYADEELNVVDTEYMASRMAISKKYDMPMVYHEIGNIHQNDCTAAIFIYKPSSISKAQLTVYEKQLALQYLFAKSIVLNSEVPVSALLKDNPEKVTNEILKSLLILRSNTK